MESFRDIILGAKPRKQTNKQTNSAFRRVPKPAYIRVFVVFGSAQACVITRNIVSTRDRKLQHCYTFSEKCRTQIF